MSAKLEEIQKALDMYLETKRQIFPRFYFLSNDDVLEILGQSQNPEAMQPHLKKCFDNIKSLRFVILDHLVKIRLLNIIRLYDCCFFTWSSLLQPIHSNTLWGYFMDKMGKLL